MTFMEMIVRDDLVVLGEILVCRKDHKDILRGGFLLVSLGDLKMLEKLFGVNVNVFQFDETNQQKPCLISVRRSKTHFPSDMNVVNYNNKKNQTFLLYLQPR
ncbi:hypothetical protein ACOMHN_032613 [Nucella lapillus]